MKIIDTYRILFLKKKCKYFKIKNIADELENNFTEEYLMHMKYFYKNWRNSLNSYFTKWKCKLFYQVKLQSGKPGYWTLYDWYLQDKNHSEILNENEYSLKNDYRENLNADKSNKRKFDDTFIFDCLDL